MREEQYEDGQYVEEGSDGGSAEDTGSCYRQIRDTTRPIQEYVQDYVPDESTRLKALSGAHGTLGTYAVMEPVYQSTVHAHALPDDLELGVRMTAGLLAAGFGYWTYSEAAKAERREEIDDIWDEVRE